MSEDIGDLLSRLREAKGPAYVLDVEIARVVGLGPRIVPRPYTASLDAALTLVPDGWDVVEADSNGGLWCFALGRGDSNHPDYREAWSWPGTDHERSIFHRKPPALALCIAALEARRETPND